MKQLVGQAVILGAVGLIAVGCSGVVAAGAGTVFGQAFVAGDAPSVHYSAADCADYREYTPGARTCEQAATEHHFTEVVWYRIAVGGLGASVLCGCMLVRRRHRRLFRADLLPLAFTDTVAAVVFGIAGAWLVGYAVDQVALGYDGAGFFLSGGAIAMVDATASATRFVRTVLGATSPSHLPA